MEFLSKLIPESIKKKFSKENNPLQLRNNIPNEKINIKKTLGIYCNQKHNTKDGHLCPKCTAMLTTILLKMKQCKYGSTKPICDHCDSLCFGSEYNKIFMEAMTTTGKKMLVKHPVMAIKHKVLGIGTDYAKEEQTKNLNEKKAARRKAKADRKAKREGKAAEGKDANEKK